MVSTDILPASSFIPPWDDVWKAHQCSWLHLLYNRLTITIEAISVKDNTWPNKIQKPGKKDLNKELRLQSRSTVLLAHFNVRRYPKRSTAFSPEMSIHSSLYHCKRFQKSENNQLLAWPVNEVDLCRCVYPLCACQDSTNRPKQTATSVLKGPGGDAEEQCFKGSNHLISANVWMVWERQLATEPQCKGGNAIDSITHFTRCSWPLAYSSHSLSSQAGLPTCGWKKCMRNHFHIG